MLKRLGVAVDLLQLEPADLNNPVPMWETAISPGSLAVAVVDGTARDWAAAEKDASAAYAELRAAQALTIAVVRGETPSRGGAALARACDLLAESSRELDALLDRIAEVPGPAVVTAQLLRGGEAHLAAESFAYATLLGSEAFQDWRGSRPRGRPEDTWTRPRVASEDDDGVLTIRLSRPAKHNAYDARMREHLCDALDAAAAGADQPVVLVGSGPSFCAGGDLDEFGTASDPFSAHVVRLGRSAARRLERIAERLVVGVHGHCIGAGVELAAFARTVVAAESTSFALPELSFGLTLGAGGSVSIPRRIGRQRTLELLVRGEPVDAPTALRWGLVDEVVPERELFDRCIERAREVVAP